MEARNVNTVLNVDWTGEIHNIRALKVCSSNLKYRGTIFCGFENEVQAPQYELLSLDRKFTNLIKSEIVYICHWLICKRIFKKMGGTQFKLDSIDISFPTEP